MTAIYSDLYFLEVASHSNTTQQEEKMYGTPVESTPWPVARRGALFRTEPARRPAMLRGPSRAGRPPAWQPGCQAVAAPKPTRGERCSLSSRGGQEHLIEPETRMRKLLHRPAAKMIV